MHPGNNSTETSRTLWSAAAAGPPIRGSKLKKSEIVQFANFEAASGTLTDSYWIDILKSCARGKFPRGFCYDNGYLHHRANNVSMLLPDDPYALAQTAKYFLQENGRLLSTADKKSQKDKEEELILQQLAGKTIDWKTISRSKNKRTTYIRDYVEKKYSHLNTYIRDELYTQINVAFELGFLSGEHVTLVGNDIEFIDGISATEEGIFYSREYPTRIPGIRNTTKINPEENKDKKYRHYANWCKYLEDYRKYMESSIKPSHTIQKSTFTGSEEIHN